MLGWLQRYTGRASWLRIGRAASGPQSETSERMARFAERERIERQRAAARAWWGDPEPDDGWRPLDL